MILTGKEIHREVESGNIVIDPFNQKNINPNSYNFRLSNQLKVYTAPTLDTKMKNEVASIDIDETGFILEPRTLYLASTIEIMGSEFYIPTYAARSSVARLGMFINLSACLGDIGFIGNWTIQLYSINRVKIYAGMNIGQIMFWCPKGRINLYNGKYQGAVGAIESRIQFDTRK